MFKKINQLFKRFYDFLKKKIGKSSFSFIYPYLELVRRCLIAAMKAIKDEYEIWKYEMAFGISYED